MEKKITIYFNPGCSKCQDALCSLEENGFETTIVEYLNEVPSEEEILDLLKKLGITARQLIRESELVFVQHYAGQDLSEYDWIRAMVTHPVLIQRPIIVRGEKAVLGRSPELVQSIIR